MKRLIINIAILAVTGTLFCSCDTDIEARVIQKPFEYTEEYYENLRAYKATMHDRSLCFVWFSEYDGQNVSLAYRFAGLPDSVDICSLWGGIPDPEQNPFAWNEMWEMRNKKGTLLVAPTIIRIMENENYANFGLTREDMVNQTTSIDPDGYFPDWCILYGNHLLQQMWDSGIDGLDLDYEPESTDEQYYGIYGSRLTLFVEYLGQFIGPMSPNPDKLLILDFASRTPPTDTEPYVNYFVRQKYTNTSHTQSSDSDYDGTFPNHKRVMTENIGYFWQDGGYLEQHAGFIPSSGGRKGGFGAFYVQRDYHTTDSGADKALPYGHLRRAIQIQNPAVTK